MTAKGRILYLGGAGGRKAVGQSDWARTEQNQAVSEKQGTITFIADDRVTCTVKLLDDTVVMAAMGSLCRDVGEVVVVYGGRIN